MRGQHYMFLTIACIPVFSDQVLAKTSPYEYCTTETDGYLEEVRYVLVHTYFSPEIRNWELKVQERAPIECARINGFEVKVCDGDEAPEVKLERFKVSIHRTGNLLGGADMVFTAYCTPL